MVERLSKADRQPNSVKLAKAHLKKPKEFDRSDNKRSNRGGGDKDKRR
jgi:hypothetical protein